MKAPTLAAASILLLLTTACSRGEQLGPRRPVGGTSRELHREAVAAAADDSEARRAWDHTGRVALAAAYPIGTTFREEFLLPPDSPRALAWTVELERAQRLALELAPRPGAGAAFLDIFEQLDADIYRHVHAGGRGSPRFEFEAPRSGRYIIRVQPEPGAGGRYELTADDGVTLVFPVQGASEQAIRSAFGDGRDGGARSHGGVDIFAPRGTPVLSVTDGVVQTVENTALGGKVVWTKDEARNLSYFYAHLDEQLVAPGMRLRAGDVIGRVGNTGNATGASPHLHFGVYRPGTLAIDPVPLIRQAKGLLPAPVADTAAARLGSWARTRVTAARLRSAPGEGGGILAELPARTRLRLVGALSDWRRVVLEDGRSGFIAGRLLEAEPTGSR